MTRMVALLRGVNVGGRKLAMADLRAAAETCGFTRVETYLQSGNVVFDPGDLGEADVGPALVSALAATTGLETEMAVRTAAQIDRVVARSPFADRTDDPTRLHVVFWLGRPASSPDWYDPAAWAPEELAVVDGETYLHLPDGMGRSKLAVEVTRRGNRAGGDRGTARNWRTVNALRDLLAAT